MFKFFLGANFFQIDVTEANLRKTFACLIYLFLLLFFRIESLLGLCSKNILSV